MDDGTRSWSTTETQAINLGVAQVGQAFDYLAATVNTPQDAFNLVMLENSGTEILFIRTHQTGLATVTISNYQYQYGSRMGQMATFSYPNIPEGYCFSYQEGIIPTDILRPAAVLCNGNLIDHYTGTTPTLEADQHTVVHELGHLFDYHTGNGLSGPIGAGAFVLEDCDSPAGTVMGAFGTWTRGRRGWGTGPAQYYNALATPVPLVTDFQQDSANIPLEAATPHPGFIADSAGIPGTPDASLPGDRRYFDMDVRIRQIFSAHGW